MAVARARKRLAKKLAQRSRKEASRSEKNHQMADVIRLKPLTLDPYGQDESLVEEDDFVLSQWVRKYHKEKEIEIGDNAILHRISGHWVVVDIVADKEP